MKKIKEFIKEIGTKNCIIVVFMLIMGISMTSMMLGVGEELESFEDTLYQQENLVDSNEENSKNKTGIFEIRKLDNDGYGLGIGYLFLIPVIIIGIIILKRYKKYQKEVRAGAIPQEHLNEFEELYSRLYKENVNELERARNKKVTKKVIYAIVIIVTIVILINNMAYTPLAFFGMIIFIILKASLKNSKSNKEYIANYKKNIVDPIIKLAIPNAIYTPKDGISESKYDEVDWDYYDTFESEDLIEGKIKLEENKGFETDITMSEVYTTYETRDSDGDTHINISFSGLVAYTTLPENIGCEIHVLRGKSSSSNLKADMTEFEKLYDIETTDKIKAMEILTADIMSDIVDLTKNSNVEFRFDIQKDKLYFKFYTGKMFEPQTFNKKMEKTMLQKYYNVVRMCVKVSKEICEIILKANI